MMSPLEWKYDEGGLIEQEAYGHWLNVIDDDADSSDIWRPRVIVADELDETEVERLLSDIRTGSITILGEWFKDFNSEDTRVSFHDFAHFLYMLLKERGRSELIVFRKQSLSKVELFPFADILNSEGEYSGGQISEEYISKAKNFTIPVSELEVLFDLLTVQATNRPGSTAQKSSVVITGIIDHAIGVANDRFRLSADETRVKAIWAQQAVPSDDDGGVAIGRVVSDSKINENLKLLALGDLENEVDLYRNIGITPAINPIQSKNAGPTMTRGEQPLSLSMTHGTCMLDIAAGRDQKDKRIDCNPILAVQLPAEIVERTNGFLHEPYIKTAMNWLWFTTLVNYGQEGVDSLVVNYSFGDYAGRHDGESILDADFQRRIERREVGMITIPIGNAFLADVHAELNNRDVEKGAELNFIVQPDDKEVTFVQMWFDQACGDKFPVQLEVTPPGGLSNSIGERIPGQHDDLCRGDLVLGRIYFQQNAPKYPLANVAENPAPRFLITLALRPTASDQTIEPLAPNGDWKIKFCSEVGTKLEGSINIWVERGDTVAGFPKRGRQAYLDHAEHQKRVENGRFNEVDDPNCLIKRFGTLGSDSNAEGAFVVGGYRADRETRMAHYSAARSVLGGSQPSLSVPIELSAARPNILASGTNSGSVRTVQGTSAASALAARELAEWLFANKGEIGKPGSMTRAKFALINKVTPSTFPTERVGAGILKVNYRRAPPRAASN